MVVVWNDQYRDEAKVLVSGCVCVCVYVCMCACVCVWNDQYREETKVLVSGCASKHKCPHMSYKR